MPFPVMSRFPCNGALIRQLRGRLEWTREDLAAYSRRSVRTIAKAETNGSISNRTAERIADAFQKAGLSVEADDLRFDPASLARQFLANYVKYQADCVQKSLDFISPDIVAYIDGDPATNPIAGEYHGIEEFDGFFRKFFRFFVRSDGNIDSPQLTVNGNEVIAWGHEKIHLPNVPPKGTGFVMLRMRFEGGRMVRFEDYYEVTGMMRALHHFADEFPDADWAKILREQVDMRL